MSKSQKVLAIIRGTACLLLLLVFFSANAQNINRHLFVQFTMQRHKVFLAQQTALKSNAVSEDTLHLQLLELALELKFSRLERHITTNASADRLIYSYSSHGYTVLSFEHQPGVYKAKSYVPERFFNIQSNVAEKVSSAFGNVYEFVQHDKDPYQKGVTNRNPLLVPTEIITVFKIVIEQLMKGENALNWMSFRGLTMKGQSDYSSPDVASFFVDTDKNSDLQKNTHFVGGESSEYRRRLIGAKKESVAGLHISLNSESKIVTALNEISSQIVVGHTRLRSIIGARTGSLPDLAVLPEELLVELRSKEIAPKSFGVFLDKITKNQIDDRLGSVWQAKVRSLFKQLAIDFSFSTTREDVLEYTFSSNGRAEGRPGEAINKIRFYQARTCSAIF